MKKITLLLLSSLFFSMSFSNAQTMDIDETEKLFIKALDSETNDEELDILFKELFELLSLYDL